MFVHLLTRRKCVSSIIIINKNVQLNLVIILFLKANTEFNFDPKDGELAPLEDQSIWILFEPTQVGPVQQVVTFQVPDGNTW